MSLPSGDSQNLENILAQQNMDNILVHQKDAIIRMINDGDLYEATAVIETLAEFWAFVEPSYAYKTEELRRRLDNAFNAQADS